jgi:hypothetical protein
MSCRQHEVFSLPPLNTQSLSLTGDCNAGVSAKQFLFQVLPFVFLTPRNITPAHPQIGRQTLAPDNYHANV